MSEPPPQYVSTHTTGESPHPKARSIFWWAARFGNIALFFGTGVLLIVLLGVGQRIGWIRSTRLNMATTSASSANEIFTCSMHPQIRQPGEGRCPICGMALVPATSSGEDLDELAVRIEPAQRRLANIKTAEVAQRPVSTTIRTIGAIQIDESRQATIASYIDGRVERLFADYTGVEVDQDDHLAVVYSPQLYSAQVEYVESKRMLDRSNTAALAVVREAQTKLVANSRQRLVELGMTAEQLTELERSDTPQSRMTIYAPIGGTVIEKLAEEGKYISAGEPIYRIANLSTVWLMLELYPEDASRIRFGQVVDAELTSMPGKTLIGRVAFIDPRVNESNRTVGVRVEFKNDDGELRPGDYARAGIAIPIGPQGKVYDQGLAGKWISPMHPQVIRDEPGDCPICGMKLVPTSRYGYVDQPVAQPASIVVPRSAVLMAGNHSVVYVETEPGRFELRSLTLGAILRDEVIVIDGVKPGELVATAGNFLIDSQMQLAGKPSLIDPTRAIIAQRERKTPLEFTDINVRSVSAEAGQQLEELYAAYFRIQQTLAQDQPPAEADSQSLHRLATALSESQDLSEPARKLLKDIATHSEHLHHLLIEKARHDAFRPISHAVVTLATLARGENAGGSVFQMFCPMVKGGAGDWLQSDDKLLNPYWGSKMLTCGDVVREISARGEIKLPAADEKTPEAEER